HDISAYSFPALAKAALPRLRAGAALLTLTYLGAVRYVPNYNTMGLAKASLEASVRFLAQSLGGKGVRVNGISAGPIKPLAASGVGHLSADTVDVIRAAEALGLVLDQAVDVGVEAGEFGVEVLHEAQVLDDAAVEAFARDQQRDARRVRRQHRGGDAALELL